MITAAMPAQIHQTIPEGVALRMESELARINDLKGLPLSAISAIAKVKSFTPEVFMLHLMFGAADCDWFKKNIIKGNFPECIFADVNGGVLVSVPKSEKGISAEKLVIALTDSTNYYRSPFPLTTCPLAQLHSIQGLALPAISAIAKVKSFIPEVSTIHLMFEATACDWFKKNVIKENFPGFTFTDVASGLFVGVPSSENKRAAEEFVIALTDRANYRSDFLSDRG